MRPEPDFPACGAWVLSGSTTLFRVWAPRVKTLHLIILGPASRGERRLVMERRGDYFLLIVPNAGAGTRYMFELDGQRRRPDPASRFQPLGVHGPSEVVDTGAFKWKNRSWRGLPLDKIVLYELHAGTFTSEGTFASAIKKIPHLKKLGITCVEVMPVAAFPGSRNWGYDGVAPYAVQASYGGPEGFRAFIDACHGAGLAVCLDVVYNHLGPEGNYLREFGPYFSDRYRTPWGEAFNYDERGSEPARRFVIDNALYWVKEFRVDALRLDAVHGIFDYGARHVLQQLQKEVQGAARSAGRQVIVISESDLNDNRVLLPVGRGGWAHDAQWSDDFHHALHTALTPERQGYYTDYDGVEDLGEAIRKGFVYDGKYSVFRMRRHGNSAAGLDPKRLVISSQNHDQVGNRPLGDRLSTLITFEAQKLAAAALLLAPQTPMLFMGQEYGETAPFLYFIDHGDPGLVKAVCEGRQREFESIRGIRVPNPKSPGTYARSKLRWGQASRPAGRALYRLHRRLIEIRRELQLSHLLKHDDLDVWTDTERRTLRLSYVIGKKRWSLFLNLSKAEQPITGALNLSSNQRLFVRLATSDREFNGRSRLQGLRVRSNRMALPAESAIFASHF